MFLGSVELVPRAVEMVLRAVGMVPRAVVPRAVEMVPRAVEIVPRAVEIVPRAVEMVLRAVEMVPRAVGMDSPRGAPLTIRRRASFECARGRDAACQCAGAQHCRASSLPRAIARPADSLRSLAVPPHASNPVIHLDAQRQEAQQVFQRDDADELIAVNDHEAR
jgi:type II secretory pathway component HofQ